MPASSKDPDNQRRHPLLHDVLKSTKRVGSPPHCFPNICSDRRGYDPQKLPPKRRISRIRAYGRAQLNPFVTRSNPE